MVQVECTSAQFTKTKLDVHNLYHSSRLSNTSNDRAELTASEVSDEAGELEK